MIIKEVKNYRVIEQCGEDLTEIKIFKGIPEKTVIQIKKINELPQIFEVKTIKEVL